MATPTRDSVPWICERSLIRGCVTTSGLVRHDPAASVCPHSAHMQQKGPVRFVRTEPLTCTNVVAGAGFEPATSGL
jgi:hypothetical protein